MASKPKVGKGALATARNRIVDHIYLKPSEIQDHPGQAWDHPDTQVRALLGGIEEVGVIDEILVYRSERAGGAWVTPDGHLRKSLDPDYPWPCAVLDVSDAEADYILATKDPIGMMKATNVEALDALLSTVTSGNAAIQQMFTDMAQKAGLYLERPDERDAAPKVDQAAELQAAWGVQVGDIWQLGVHRLICGDCTLPAVYQALLAGERAEVVITSPPYNVAAKSSLPNKDKYLHADDELDETAYLDLLNRFTALALDQAQYVFVNVQSVAGNKTALIDYLHTWRDKYADTLIWDKQSAEPAMAHNVLNSRFEYVHVFSQRGLRVIGCREFRGTLDNVLCLSSKGDKVAGHKATFPVAFAKFFVEFANPQGLVLDPFCGTGTTLIACQQAGRVGRGIELDPGYVAVALERYREAFGVAPEKLNA